MRYELWVAGDGTEATFAPPENIKIIRKHAGLGKNAKLKWTVEADTWEEAMTKYHEHMGWEPYKPFPKT